MLFFCSGSCMVILMLTLGSEAQHLSLHCTVGCFTNSRHGRHEQDRVESVLQSLFLLLIIVPFLQHTGSSSNQLGKQSQNNPSFRFQTKQNKQRNTPTTSLTYSPVRNFVLGWRDSIAGNTLACYQPRFDPWHPIIVPPEYHR